MRERVAVGLADRQERVPWAICKMSHEPVRFDL
jgi:hypothetical protein